MRRGPEPSGGIGTASESTVIFRAISASVGACTRLVGLTLRSLARDRCLAGRWQRCAESLERAVLSGYEAKRAWASDPRNGRGN